MKKRTVLTARDGFIYTDGEIYGKKIYLADGADASKYYEITIEQYTEITAKEEPNADTI